LSFINSLFLKRGSAPASTFSLLLLPFFDDANSQNFSFKNNVLGSDCYKDFPGSNNFILKVIFCGTLAALSQTV